MVKPEEITQTLHTGERPGKLHPPPKVSNKWQTHLEFLHKRRKEIQVDTCPFLS